MAACQIEQSLAYPPCSRPNRDWLGSKGGDVAGGDGRGPAVPESAVRSSPEDVSGHEVLPGLIPSALSSGHRKTSMGPCLLLREI